MCYSSWGPTAGLRLYDRAAIHEPHGGGAADGIAPDDVGLAVAIEIGGGLCQSPLGRAATAEQGGTIHEPNAVPRCSRCATQIGLAVAVEIRTQHCRITTKEKHSRREAPNAAAPPTQWG